MHSMIFDKGNHIITTTEKIEISVTPKTLLGTLVVNALCPTPNDLLCLYRLVYII